MFLFCLILFLLSASPAMAIAKFSNTYNISYNVSDSGQTHVIFDILQINNLSQVYATDYALSVGQTDVRNVLVTDTEKPVTPEITRTDNLTTITFSFINKIAGINKEHRFRLEYDTNDIAQKQGSVWEINIPKLNADENISSQTITINTPTLFPEIAYIDPPPSRISGHTYYYGSNTINRPISALFGQTQYYAIKAKYYLNNPNITKANQEIALPPDTNYQQVFIKTLSPQAKSIKTDTDGNWLAIYEMQPHQQLEIDYEAVVKLNFVPKPNIYPPDKLLTSANEIWNFTDSVFSTSELAQIKSAKEIYSFVVNHLKYNYAKINKSDASRQNGSFAYQNPDQSICTEFTTLFVTLARKNKIPAREIQGYAFSQNDILKPLSLEKDVLHSWPEYFNQQTSTWTQVDPTWEHTTNGIDYFNKLDLSHIAFVIHGQNPISPLPLGAYKNPSNPEKIITVTPIQPVDIPKPNLSVDLANQAGNTINVAIVNPSLVGYRGLLDFQIGQSSTHRQPVVIPPLSHQSIPLELDSPVKSTSDLIINLNDQSFKFKLEPQEFPVSNYFFYGSGVVAIIAFISWRLYLRRSKIYPPIHW